jgi:uncharacterized membrane protein
MNTLTVLLSATPWWLSSVIEDIVICAIVFSIPILIAILSYRRKVNETNKRAEVALAALEKGSGEMPEELMKSLNKPQKSIKERLLGKLLWGLSFTIFGAVLLVAKIVRYNAGNTDEMISLGGIALLALGIGYLVYYFVGRRMLSKEIEAEERENLKEN